MPDISIAMALTDKVSPGLRNMASSNSAFNKSLQETEQRAAAYSKRMDALQKEAASLKTRLTDSNKAVKEAKKAYTEYGDELSRNRLQSAIEEQEVLQNSLKDTQKAMANARNEMFKFKSEAGGGSLGSGLMKSGLTQQLGNAAASFASGFLESSLGQPTADAISSIASGIASGAAAGMIAGPTGAAIGAAIGGLSGAINALTTVSATKDEAFKSYYTNLYDTTKAAVSEGITAGSTIAGSREQTMLAFTQRFGSADAAQGFLDSVKEMAKSTNYTYDEITGYAKSLLNTYSVEEVFDVLQALSDVTAGLNLSSSDVNMFISGLSRMRTTGKATQEYLNYFSERGVDVYTALAGTLGVDKSAIAGMVTKGEISGETAAASILDYINANYGGLSEKLAGTYDAMVSNLEDVMANVAEGFGGGYNTIRKLGLQAESDAYGGDLGKKLYALNSIAGSNQAFLDNLGEQYKREALAALLLGQRTTLDFGGQEGELAAMFREYAGLEEKYNESGDRSTALRMEELRRLAETIATNAYESSDEFQMVREVELDSIEATRELTAAFNAWTNAYTEQQERSKGQASTKPMVSQWDMSAGPAGAGYAWAARAMGVGRVPYDNFPVLLHEGERVLTAQQARAADRSHGGVIVNINGEFNVRSDEDISAIAEAVAEQFRMEALAGVYAVS